MADFAEQSVSHNGLTDFFVSVIGRSQKFAYVSVIVDKILD